MLCFKPYPAKVDAIKMFVLGFCFFYRVHRNYRYQCHCDFTITFLKDDTKLLLNKHFETILSLLISLTKFIDPFTLMVASIPLTIHEKYLRVIMKLH